MSNIIIHPSISGPGLGSLMQRTGMEIDDNRAPYLRLVRAPRPNPLQSTADALAMLSYMLSCRRYEFTDQTEMGERQ